MPYNKHHFNKLVHRCMSFISRYDCRIITALTLSTNALFCLTFFFAPDSSIAAVAILDVKRSSTRSTGIKGKVLCRCFTNGSVNLADSES